MKMLVAPEFCVRPFGGACERCRIACPVAAISFSDERSTPVIDEDACTTCGVCMGVCDAFLSSSTSLHALYEHLRRVAMRGELVYLTCTENVFPGFQPADNVTILPCLACIPPEMWALLLAQNVPLCLTCDLKYCDDCDKAPQRGAMLFSRAIEIAEEWTGGSVHWDREIPENQEKISPAEAAPAGRREIFDNIKDDALDLVSGKRRLKNSDTLKELYRRRERSRMRERLNLVSDEALNRFATGGRSKRVLLPRRRMIMEALVADASMGERVELAISQTDEERCDACLECTRVCPTGARIPSPEDGSLDYDQRFCIGCDACTEACPRQAVTMTEFTLSQITQLAPEAKDSEEARRESSRAQTPQAPPASP